MALLGCGGPTDTDPDGDEPLTVITGAPTAGTAPENVEIPLEEGSTPTALSLYYGAAAVGTSNGVEVGSLSTNSLNSLLVVPLENEPVNTGKVLSLVPRASGGLFAVAEEGLFHDGQGVLLYSPLNGAPELQDNPIVALDAAGSAETEELWITTTNGAYYLAGGSIVGLQVTDGEGSARAADAVVGVDKGEALFVSGGQAFLVDVAQATADLVIDDLGALSGFARAEDGAVYLATDKGLFIREPDGALSVRTFAPEGSPAAKVIAVAASFGTVVAATDGALIAIDDNGAQELASISSMPGGLTVDGQGDVWSLDGEKVVRHITGAPVSFESDVKPFLDQHCAGCHSAGINGAPIVDFLDYEVAVDRAPTIVKRLKGEGSVMPPVSIEVLTAADYAVVIRWVAGGMLP